MTDSHEITRPYPGLRPFESWEGEIFFGREEHTNRLLDILKERHFLAVIGPSGSGKSSLVRAGLLPSLPLGSLGTGSNWRIAIMRPGNRPIRSLTHALLARSTLGIELVGEEHIPQDASVMTPDVALIEADLRRGPLGFIDIVQDARTRQTGKDAFNLLVLVDQFEELFTYADAEGRQADEAEAFVNLLLAPQTVPEARIYIVLTMRTDFLGNCVRFLELPDAINRAQYLTPRLTREQIERAIASPAYLFDGDVEPTLVTELINAVSNDPDQLPILQHALSRMWDEASQRQSESPCIAWNDFYAVGGITNALSLHADEILATLSPRNQIEQPLCPEQQAAADLFRAITEQRSAEAGGQAVRRPQSLARIAKWSERKWQDFKPVIDAYSREGINFLHINSPLNSDTIVDISHESLIRQWQRLRDWVAQETRLADEYQRFLDRTEAFKNGSGAKLTGADLARALEWRNGTFSKGRNNVVWQPTANWADRYRKNKDVPANTEFSEVLRFIDDSHAVKLKEERRERNRTWALRTLTVLSMCTTLGVFWYAYDKKIETEAAQLWRPLNFHSPIINVTKDQSSGLQNLALANDVRKQTFFDQLMEDQARTERFINNPEVIMTAMVGISPARKKMLLDRLDATPHQNADIFHLARFFVLSELEEKGSSKNIMSALALKDNDSEDLISLKRLNQLIKTLIGKMDKTGLETLSSSILHSVNDPAIDNEVELEPRAEGLAAVIELIPPENLNKIADQLINNIKKAKNPLQLDTLKKSLAHVAENMQDEQQVGALAKQLFTAIKESLDPGQIEAFGKALEKLAPKISETYANELVENLIILIKNSPPNTYKSFKTLRQSLASTAARKQDEQPIRATANQLYNAIKAFLDPGQIEAFGKGFETLAPKISETHAEELVEHPIILIKDSGDAYSSIETLRQSLVSIAARKQYEQKAGELAKQLFTAMKESKDPEQFDALGQGLAAVATEIPALELKQLTDQLIDTIKNPSQLQIMGQGLQGDVAHYRTIGESLAAMIKMMPEEQAKTLAKTLFSDIINSDMKKKPMDTGQFNALGQGLAEATAKITQTLDANTFANQLMLAIKKLNDVNKVNKVKGSYMPFSALVEGMTGIAKQISAQEAYDLAHQFIKLIEALGKKQYLVKFAALGKGLAELAAKVSEDQASDLTGQIITATEASKLNRMQTMAFGPGIAKAAANIPAIEIDKEAIFIISKFKDSNDTQLKVYVKALEAMVKNLPENKVLVVADQLIDAINELSGEPKDEYRSKIKTLGKGLKAVTEKVPENQVEELTSRLIDVINASSDPEKNEALGQGLAEACAKTNPEGAIAMADKLITAMMKDSTSPSRLEALGQGLPVVAEKLPEPRRKLAKQLVEIILQTQNSSQLQVQGQVLKVITGESKPDDKTLVNWFELLKNPLTPRDILAAAIVQRLPYPDAPKENQGVWNLIEWAKQHYPGIDLEAPLKEPAIQLKPTAETI